MRLWMILPVVVVMIGCADDPMVNPIETIHPEVRNVRVKRISDMGRFIRAVKLETTEASLLGNIETVKVDARNGDLIVADLKASKGVYRFGPQGRFLTQYGRSGSGPGEYDSLLDFTVRHDGSVVLLTSYKLIAFNAEGQFLRERQLDITGLRLTRYQNHLMVYGLKRRGPSQVVWAFDSHLDPVRRFHGEDPHIRQLMFMPREVMASSETRFFVGEPFQGALTVYESGLMKGRKYVLPKQGNEAALAAAWQKYDPNNDASAQRVAALVHRIENLHAVGGWLHFTELAQGGRIFRTHLFNPEQQVIYRYGPARLLKPGPNSPDLGLDAIAGSDAQGLIGVLYNPETFARYKHQYPALREVTFADTDNPLLLFFQYHTPNAHIDEEVSP